MNNTANLRRIDTGRIADAFPARRVATIIASAIFSILMISFRPFTPAGGEGTASGGGDIVNQLGFGSLGAISIFALMTFVDRRVLAAIASPSWLLLLFFFGMAVANATDPATAARSAVFTMTSVIAVLAILTLPRDADSFSAVLRFGGLLVVGLCFAGIVALPGIAIHSAASVESQHAGFWRGLFAHKNVAGPVMACFSFTGLYLWRRGWNWSGMALFFGALVFMANTGSKTTVGLVPLTVILIMGPGLIGMRAMIPTLFTIAVAGTLLGTLGIVYIEPLKDFAAEWFPGLTYTGRTYLWSFAGELFARKPWTGYGYESLWGPYVQSLELPFDNEWDIRGSVHGHNGYLDLALMMGIPGLLAALIAFVVAPLRDFMRVPMLRENILLADLFIMLLLFTSLNACLESFFFRRVDPVWVFFLIGVIGLRLVARFPVKTNVGA